MEEERARQEAAKRKTEEGGAAPAAETKPASTPVSTDVDMGEYDEELQAVHTFSFKTIT